MNKLLVMAFACILINPGLVRCDEAEVKTLDFSTAKRFGSPAFVADFFIHAFQLSPKGNYAALLERPGSPVRKTRLELWNIPKELKETTLQLDGATTALAFSADDSLLAIYDSDGSITVYSSANWSISSRITTNARAYSLLVFSPDGTSLLLGNAEGSLQLIDIGMRRIRAGFEVDLHRTQLCGFLPGGRIWAFGATKEWRSILKVVDVEKRTTTSTQVYEHSAAAAPAPDGRSLVLAADDRVRRLDLENPAMGEWSKVLWPEFEGIQTIAVLSDNRRAIVSTRARFAVIDVQAGCAERTLDSLRDIRHVQAVAEGLFAHCDAYRLRVFEAERAATRNPGHAVHISSVLFDPMERRLFSTDTRTLLSWVETTSEPPVVPFPDDGGATRPLDASTQSLLARNQHLLVAPMSNNRWLSVDMKALTSKILHTGLGGNTEDVAVSREPDGDVFWTCAHGVFVGIDAASGKERYRTGERRPSVASALSETGDSGLLLDTHETLTLISLPRGDVKGRRSLEGINAYAPKFLGQRFAVAAHIRVNSAKEVAKYPGSRVGDNWGVCIGTLPGEESVYHALRASPLNTFMPSPDACLVAICRRDGTVEVWDLKSRQEVANGRLSAGVGTALCWEGSRILFVGTSLGTIHKVTIGS